jgi:carboxypeptidase D
VTTSDDIVHGQVKQSDNFAFVRVYESGHEVPFYQPLLALEMFDRAINGYDIATGKNHCKEGYKTVGTARSEYREGNTTMQWEILPKNATYNTTTNMPNPIHHTGPPAGKTELKKRTLSGKRLRSSFRFLMDGE